MARLDKPLNFIPEAFSAWVTLSPNTARHWIQLENEVRDQIAKDRPNLTWEPFPIGLDLRAQLQIILNGPPATKMVVMEKNVILDSGTGLEFIQKNNRFFEEGDVSIEVRIKTWLKTSSAGISFEIQKLIFQISP